YIRDVYGLDSKPDYVCVLDFQPFNFPDCSSISVDIKFASPFSVGCVFYDTKQKCKNLGAVIHYQSKNEKECNYRGNGCKDLSTELLSEKNRENCLLCNGEFIPRSQWVEVWKNIYIYIFFFF